MEFKYGVKNIQAAGYNGGRKVDSGDLKTSKYVFFS